MSEQGSPGRTLGAFDIGCVVVGGIIGVGIFFTPSKVAQAVDAPWQVILAWGAGGVLALLGALVFAELSTLVPGHGGTFLYIRKSFGRVPAFLYGWANWLVIQAGAQGIVGLVFADYLDRLLHGAETFSTGERFGLAVAACLLFTAINALGLRVGKGVQNSLTVLKVVAVFGLVLLGFLAGGAETGVEVPAPAEPRGLPTILAAAMLPVLFAMGGWQHGSFLAGAARRPLRDVPLGIVAGVAVVVLAYMTVNLAFLDLLGFEGARTSTAVGADAAQAALEPWGWGEAAGRVFAGLVVLSSLGIMNTICLAPPFVLHAMSVHGLFPRAIGRLHEGTGSPTLAIAGQGGAAVLWLLVMYLGTADPAKSLDFVLNGVVFADWLFFLLCGLALVRLRRGAREGAFRAPCGGIVAWLFALGALGVTVGSVAVYPLPSLVGLGLCALGLPFALLANRA